MTLEIRMIHMIPQQAQMVIMDKYSIVQMGKI